MTSAIIEAAIGALRGSLPGDEVGHAMRVLTAVTPLIRAAALEEAAQVADDFVAMESDPGEDIAALIRALKAQP